MGDSDTIARPGGATDDLTRGARNLLERCAEARAGDRVVIAQENPELGWYDNAAPDAVAIVAGKLGAVVRLIQVEGPEAGMPADLTDALVEADIAIFFARIGDQYRFGPRRAGTVHVVSYARTAGALASTFGTRDHHEMLALKAEADRRTFDAQVLRISCPNGTNLAGTPGPRHESTDVTIRRFPMCVPAPVPASGFSGRVALGRFLAPTGSRSYTPACLALPERIFAEVENGRIAAFDGSPDLVQRVRDHYARVADRFGIDAHAVHSWHAGLHGGCRFNRRAEDDPDLWANTVFAHPNFLHLHTCGAYAPGEICWMVEAPSIWADDEPLWHGGQLMFDDASCTR